MKTILLILLFSFPLVSVAEEFYYPKTDIFSVSGGIYYDNPGKINSMLKKVIGADDLISHVYYLDFNYKINHNPIIWNSPYFILYSLNLQVPFSRKTSNIYYNAELQTYSASVEISTFESYVKTVTVHPLIGLGLSYTELLMPVKYSEALGINCVDDKMNKYEKSNLNLILGGGSDLRLNLRESEQERKNLLLSFEVRYSINLDVLGIIGGDWEVGRYAAIGIPDYIGPGLSIELKIGIENQRK
jgi:hypothetical protein